MRYKTSTPGDGDIIYTHYVVEMASLTDVKRIEF